jgi:NAD-dependent SIR2 family protein deacetylase
MKAFHESMSALQTMLDQQPRLLVISGAGISIASGIPAYRDHLGVWRHSTPVTHQEFIADPGRRRRYWARSLLGWPAVRDAHPNAAHHALAQLEREGRIHLLITQNVDRLHQRAGSEAVVDLHGRVDRVRCLDCGRVMPREQVQQQLSRDNPHSHSQDSLLRPDGVAEVAQKWVVLLRVPTCGQCGGTLMPDVIFYGGNVPRDRVARCNDAVADADAVLVVGSSLQVYSGFRFCRLAKQLGKPLVIVNPGQTRADALADLKIPLDCEPVLVALASGVTAGAADRSSAAGSPS